MKNQKLRKFTNELGDDFEKLLTEQMNVVRGGKVAPADPCPSCKTACQAGCMSAAVNG